MLSLSNPAVITFVVMAGLVAVVMFKAAFAK